MFCNLNGRFYNDAKATISINNRSFRYGDGCFETIKICKGKILHSQLHMDRLFGSMQVLKFQPATYFNAGYIIELINELVKKNSHQKLARVRLTIFRGEGGLYDIINHTPNFLIQSWPLNQENNTINENGLILGLYDEGFKSADGFSNIKSNNYLLYAMAALYAKANHFNDVIVKNNKGSVADTTIANLWLIKNDTIITPPLADGGVAGVMRSYLLKAFTSKGLNVQEASIYIDDFSAADEIFLTNVIYGMKWVKQIDNKTFTGNRIKQLHADFILPTLN